MGGATKIEWTDVTWSPVTGCTKVSAGCAHCYADRVSKRLAGRCGYPKDEPFRLTLHPDRLNEPLGWRKPRMVFVCSMSDLFHDAVPFAFIDRVFAIMGLASQHKFQVLSKRPERMREYLRRRYMPGAICDAAIIHHGSYFRPDWPFPNVWIGVSVESQALTDRIETLLGCPAVMRFVSAEPLLGPLDLTTTCINPPAEIMGLDGPYLSTGDAGIDWLICGCESGPHRRPMETAWAVDLRRQCESAGVPFFMKQMEVNGKVSHDPAEWPEELRVRQMPEG